MAVRADAQRNREALLTQAVRTLSEHPDASVHDIAAAAGLTRTTAYRHFPSRDSLLAAIHARVESEARELVVDAVALEHPDAVLAQLSERILGLAERYRFLAAQPPTEAQGPTGEQEMGEWLRAARGRGEIDSGPSIEWQQAMIRGMAMAACDEGGPEAAAELTRSLKRLLLA